MVGGSSRVGGARAGVGIVSLTGCVGTACSDAAAVAAVNVFPKSMSPDDVAAPVAAAGVGLPRRMVLEDVAGDHDIVLVKVVLASLLD